MTQLVCHALRGVSEVFFFLAEIAGSLRVPCGFLDPKKKVFTQRASGWSRTVTNRLLWRLSQQDPGSSL